MKILYFIHDNKKGGAAQSFLDMIRGVMQFHDVVVFTPHARGYIPDRLEEMGVEHHHSRYYWWEIAKTGNPILDAIRFQLYKILNVYNCIEARRLAPKIRRMDIDIIHSNSSTINIGELVSEITGIDHVWHLRELGLPEYPLYPVRKKDSLDTVIRRGDSSYIAISEYAKRFFSKYVNDINRIYVVYNGISSAYDYKKDIHEYGKDEISFLISGNYCEEKGQIDVAHAAEVLVARGVTSFKIYMAGRGDFAEVKKCLSEKGLEDYVVFCGLVDDMLSLRKKCDVEIVASKTEAFGRVTVEAMRASNPVIGSNTGGTTELIADGITGFLYKYKDDNDLADCMKRFIDNPGLISEMGQRAYAWSVDKFTSEENVRKILELYKSIKE